MSTIDYICISKNAKFVVGETYDQTFFLRFYYKKKRSYKIIIGYRLYMHNFKSDDSNNS